MARELKDTNNRICQNAPAGLSDTKCIITVGDICTIKIYEQARMPDLSIIDFKTKRNIQLSLEEKNIMDQIGEKIVNVKNNAGTISDELWNAIKVAISDNVKTRIVVKGEEDLATLTTILVFTLSEIATLIAFHNSSEIVPALFLTLTIFSPIWSIIFFSSKDNCIFLLVLKSIILRSGILACS
jgi:hypothetical protein